MIFSKVAFAALLLAVSTTANLASLSEHETARDLGVNDIKSKWEKNDVLDSSIGPEAAEQPEATATASISMRAHGVQRKNSELASDTSSTRGTQVSGRRATSSEAAGVSTSSLRGQGSTTGGSSQRRKGSGRPERRRAAQVEDEQLEDDMEHGDNERDLQLQARIVGGKRASIGEYPFYIQWYGRNEGTCGASLIWEDVMITAAHCGLFSNDVYVGAYKHTTAWQYGTEKRRIVQRSRHPRFNSRTLEHDFEVMKLDSAVKSIPPVKLNSGSGRPYTGEVLTVVGMGDTTDGGDPSNFLQEVNVPVVSSSKCNSQLSMVGGITSSLMFCAGLDQGGKDACQQDSGGPIVSYATGEPVQVGLVSWGIGCAQRNRPGVYARISAEYDWIQAQICRFARNPPASCSGNTGSGGYRATPTTRNPTPTPTPEPTSEPTPQPTPSPTASPTSGCESGTVELMVEMTMDDFGEDNSFQVMDDDSGGVVLNAANFGKRETKRFRTCVDPNKCYTLEVADSFGDGMCCEYGNGGYRAFLDGTQVVSGGDFDTPTDVREIGNCEDDGTLTSNELVMDVTTDNWGGETHFYVRNVQTNQLIYQRSPETLNDNTVFEFKIPIDPDLCYELTIRDAWGDGMCCEQGFGSFSARVGTVLVAEFGNFGSTDNAFFGNGCS